ncbi:D-alanyl-D-alanine carboxypeptidase [Pedobacter metabolipauper]|nr:D-alanyl-D-alanine carboxypeptidase [Pedobacter metabolipauper]
MDRKIARKVNRQFKDTKVFKQHHIGFALYNRETKNMIFEKDAEKYFTPASNTKLFTFYAGLKILPDSIPSLRFIERGDSLIFWGTGDPSFLQSNLKGTKAFDFLKISAKKLYYAAGRYTGDFYGKGWQWDDYNDYYQAEINELPILDNLIQVKSKGNGIQVIPKLFEDCFSVDSADQGKTFSVTRHFNENVFKYPLTAIPASFTQQLPYKVSTTATIALLADTLGKEVGFLSMKMPSNAETVYNLKRDSVLKEMMLPSDNFIAEQLLLVYANQADLEMNAEKVIDYIEKNYLASLPDKPKWVDGSGLSRYNLVTPRDLIRLLELIYDEVNDPKKLFSMLPAGGMTGTLKNAYPRTNDPFVFGKTGTVSNNHNQSGYVRTKKGKIYLFSFMNNNYVLPTAAVRTEMVRIITYIHENF